jgi:hypothetical protein
MSTAMALRLLRISPSWTSPLRDSAGEFTLATAPVGVW